MAWSSETIVLDKGKQFTSVHLKVYYKNNAIEHVLSPSYHTQSNGQAGNFGVTLKRALLKNKRGRMNGWIIKTIP